MVFMETENHRPRIREFLGGWRSRITGILYYNASTQTELSGGTKRQRILQTVTSVDKFTDMQRDEVVQSTLFPDLRDRFLRSKSSRAWDSNSKGAISDKEISESVLKIQRFYRSYRARVTTSQPGVALESLGETKDDDRREVSSETAPYRSTDFTILNRTAPKTRRDFELVYNLLDRWRILETSRWSQLHDEPSRIGLCSVILSKEVELLRAIESTKTLVKRKRRERSYRKFLEELSRPLLWRDSRGEPILVYTPRVQRARDFRSTYDSLSKGDPSSSERLNLLFRLKRAIRMHTCRHSSDLIYLIDQEIDLLSRDVDEMKLNWLRRRLKITFLRFARDSLKDHRDAGSFERREPRKTCRNCGRLLVVEKFPRERQFRACSSCNLCLYLKASKKARVLYEPFERMLRGLRRHEAKLECQGGLAFVIDAKIVYHLVNDVWQGRSTISGSENLDELRLVRFYKGLEWTPWNCLLLTRTEASVHHKIDNLEGFYGSSLLHKFRTKNLQAKVCFESGTEIKRDREK